jgi:hypothetical protein
LRRTLARLVMLSTIQSNAKQITIVFIAMVSAPCLQTFVFG